MICKEGCHAFVYFHICKELHIQDLSSAQNFARLISQIRTPRVRGPRPRSFSVEPSLPFLPQCLSSTGWQTHPGLPKLSHS